LADHGADLSRWVFTQKYRGRRFNAHDEAAQALAFGYSGAAVTTNPSKTAGLDRPDIWDHHRQHHRGSPCSATNSCGALRRGPNRSLEHARQVLADSIGRYNREWLLEHHSYMTPAEVRESFTQIAA
jgi:hypothetical protein